MLHKINDIIGIVTVLLILIFSFFLISIQERKRLDIKLLFYFLLVNAVYIIAYLLFSIVRRESILIVLLSYALNSTGFLFGPLLYLYSKTVTYNISKLNKREVYNLIPFLTVMVYIFTKAAIFPMQNENWMVGLEAFIYRLIFNLTVLIYLVLAINEFLKYRGKIRNFYSSIEKLRYSWLAIVLVGFLSMWVIDFFHFLGGEFFVIGPKLSSSLVMLSLFINLVFAILIYYKGLKHPQLFHPIEINDKKPKYEKSTLTDYQADLFLNQLKDFMLKEKPYLKPDITISEISERVQIPSRFISQIINNSLKQNFYEFISYYRIEESKKYLSDPQFTGKTILEILYESGFNSKSAFNKDFKDQTGITPTQFRRRYLSTSKE